MKKQTEPKRAYALLLSEMADPSFTHVRPIIVTDGESGFHQTDWSWKKEHAEAARDDLNKRLGRTKAEAERIFAQSFRPDPAKLGAARHACDLALDWLELENDAISDVRQFIDEHDAMKSGEHETEACFLCQLRQVVSGEA